MTTYTAAERRARILICLRSDDERAFTTLEIADRVYGRYVKPDGPVFKRIRADLHYLKRARRVLHRPPSRYMPVDTWRSM